MTDEAHALEALRTAAERLLRAIAAHGNGRSEDTLWAVGQALQSLEARALTHRHIFGGDEPSEINLQGPDVA